MLKYKEHIFERLSRWCSIDKVRETTKNSGNIGIKEFTRESVCRSVKDNGRFENKLWGLYDYGAD